MKKHLISAVTALALAAAMHIPALAENRLTNQSAGAHTMDVQGKYQAGAAAVDIISVDIQWVGLEFTYTAGNAGTWNPAEHIYTDGTEGSWNDEKGSITVTNHSNVAVTAGFAFEFSCPTDGKDIRGVFYEQNAPDDIESTNPVLTLASAVGTKRENAPNNTIYFGVSGKDCVIAEDGTLGVITVTIAKSDET